MRGHGLMQAIARVNRVFNDKPAGCRRLHRHRPEPEERAGQYTKPDQDKTGIDEAEAVAVHAGEVRDRARHVPRLRLCRGVAGTPQERLQSWPARSNGFSTSSSSEAAAEKTEEGKKQAHRRYEDGCLRCPRRLRWHGQSDEARASATKSASFRRFAPPGEDGRRTAEHRQDRELAIQQIVAAPWSPPRSSTFLRRPDADRRTFPFCRTSSWPKSSRWRRRTSRWRRCETAQRRDPFAHATNVVETAFSERLEEAIARYHANAITTAEVIQELIQLAKDIRAARARGEEEGLPRKRSPSTTRWPRTRAPWR